MKEITYTIPEFLEMKRSDELYKKLGHNEKKLITKVIVKGTAMALFLINHPAIAFAADGLDKIDELGLSFLIISRRIAYWILGIAAIYEILKCSRQGGDKKEITEIIMKYVLLYASLFLVPKAFDFVGKYLG